MTAALPPGAVTPPPPAAKQPAAPNWFYANPANPSQWASDIIGQIGGPTSGAGYTSDLDFLLGWYNQEGGNWHNNATANPLNTTLNLPGSQSINSVGVKAYQNWAQGNQATEQTLAGYPAIDAALKAGNASQEDLSGLFGPELKTWSTGSPSGAGGYSSVGLGSVPGGALSGGAPGTIGSSASAIAGTLGSQVLPGQLSQQQEAQLLGQQLQLTPQELAFQQQILGQNYGFSQQQFGIQSQQLGLQGTELSQQLAHTQQQYNFEQQQNTLSGQNITSAINNILQNYGIAQKQFGVEQQQIGTAETGEAEQFQQGLGSAAASGTFNTGSKHQLQQQHALNLQSFSQQQQSLGLQETSAKVAEQYNVFQQQQARKQLGITEAQQKSELGYSTQQIQNGRKSLALQQKSLGISEAQAKVQYQNALAQLGLNNLMNVNQLEQQIAIMAGGGYSPLSSMMTQLTQALPQLSGLITGGNG